MILNMMAKPNKTIREHTDELLENADILYKYEYIDKEMYGLLKKACEYHDYGKANASFQKRVTSERRLEFNNNEEVAHNVLSIFTINPEDIGNQEDYLRICYAIVNHHTRVDNLNEMKEKEELIFEFIKEKNLFFKDGIGDITGRIDSLVRKRIFEDKQKDDIKTQKLKGLLHKCDYSASGEYRIEYPNDFLLDSMKNLEYKWNNLQNWAMENTNENIIAIANTGMGKTEAGLLWIGNNKGYFILPLKTAINAVYKRISENIVVKQKEDRIALLHSDSLEYYINLNKDMSETNSIKDNIFQYYERGKNLSIPLTVATLDQIFNFVYKYKGFELKLATLSYSKIVIDEIQAYSPDLLAYLIYGLESVNKAGGKFAILTATLPPFIKDKIVKNIPEVKVNSFTGGVNRHNVKVINERMNSKSILEHYYEKKGKTLIICNTVREAQKMYEEITEAWDEGIEKKELNINLLHAKFIKKHRIEKEERILKFGKTEMKDSGIWISTSLVEASLDIDFDYLFSDLSDLNSFFQRLGRVNRKGYKSEMLIEPNAYIFTEIDKNLLLKEDGSKGFIDKKIYELSKEALQEVDGILTEDKKVELIEKYLTTENIKKSNYEARYRIITEFIRGLFVGEKELAEVQKMFRNIVSYKVIPEEIYLKNEQRIRELEVIINSKDNFSNLEKKEQENIKIEIKASKIVAKSEMDSYTVSVSKYDFSKEIDKIDLVFESIKVVKCYYSEEVGFKKIKIDKDKIEDVYDNFI